MGGGAPGGRWSGTYIGALGSGAGAGAGAPVSQSKSCGSSPQRRSRARIAGSASRKTSRRAALTRLEKYVPPTTAAASPTSAITPPAIRSVRPLSPEGPSSLVTPPSMTPSPPKKTPVLASVKIAPVRASRDASRMRSAVGERSPTRGSRSSRRVSCRPLASETESTERPTSAPVLRW